MATERRRQHRLCHRRCVQGFLGIACVDMQKMNGSEQKIRTQAQSLRHHTAARLDMTFITEVRGPNWLEGKNLHMACVDEFVFGTRGQVGINVDPDCLQNVGKLELGW